MKGKPSVDNKAVNRRHSEAALQPWVLRNETHLHSAFTITAPLPLRV